MRKNGIECANPKDEIKDIMKQISNTPESVMFVQNTDYLFSDYYKGIKILVARYKLSDYLIMDLITNKIIVYDDISSRELQLFLSAKSYIYSGQL